MFSQQGEQQSSKENEIQTDVSASGQKVPEDLNSRRLSHGMTLAAVDSTTLIVIPNQSFRKNGLSAKDVLLYISMAIGGLGGFYVGRALLTSLAAPAVRNGIAIAYQYLSQSPLYHFLVHTEIREETSVLPAFLSPLAENTVIALYDYLSKNSIYRQATCIIVAENGTVQVCNFLDDNWLGRALKKLNISVNIPISAVLGTLLGAALPPIFCFSRRLCNRIAGNAIVSDQSIVLITDLNQDALSEAQEDNDYLLVSFGQETFKQPKHPLNALVSYLPSPAITLETCFSIVCHKSWLISRLALGTYDLLFKGILAKTPTTSPMLAKQETTAALPPVEVELVEIEGDYTSITKLSAKPLTPSPLLTQYSRHCTVGNLSDSVATSLLEPLETPRTPARKISLVLPGA